MEFTYNDFDGNSEFDSYGRGTMGGDKGFDSDDSRVRMKSNDKVSSQDGMGIYNMLKIFNNILYITTIVFAVGYFRSTKFTSKFVFYTFEVLLIVRPSLVLLYALVRCGIELRR